MGGKLSGRNAKQTVKKGGTEKYITGREGKGAYISERLRIRGRE